MTQRQELQSNFCCFFELLVATNEFAASDLSSRLCWGHWFVFFYEFWGWIKHFASVSVDYKVKVLLLKATFSVVIILSCWQGFFKQYIKLQIFQLFSVLRRRRGLEKCRSLYNFAHKILTKQLMVWRCIFNDIEGPDGEPRKIAQYYNAIWY